MDTTASYTAADVARGLGTTIPRVVRALERAGVDARAANGRLAITQSVAARLRDELGVTPRVEGLPIPEVQVLAALSRAPLGLASARVVAGRARVSPTTAAKALRSLENKGLVRHEDTTIAAGRVRHVRLFYANRSSPGWVALSEKLALVRPARRSRSRDVQVPPRLRHLFWNTAPAQLNVDRSGTYIARRLLTTMDFDGLAWGAENLRPSDWEQAAQGRGFDDSTRALATNLAHGDAD